MVAQTPLVLKEGQRLDIKGPADGHIYTSSLRHRWEMNRPIKGPFLRTPHA